MSIPFLPPLRPAFALGLALGCVALAAAPAAAQQPALYSLNTNGTLCVNATVIDSLPGSKWIALIVDGPDRYALRDDGLVYKNGAKLYKLNCKDSGNKDVNEGKWVGMTLYNGSIWALSAKGYLAQDGTCVTQLQTGDFEFATIFTGPTGTWSLRKDGALFSNTTITFTYSFVAGPGIDPDLGEGEAPDTTWMSGAAGALGLPWALRRDGKIVSGDLIPGDPPDGTLEAALPFSNTANASTLYSDLLFTEDGSWNALRGNGRLFREPDTLNPVQTFNGDSPTYVDLLMLPSDLSATTTDQSLLALRKDGKLYRENGSSAIGDLPKSGYGLAALGMEAPDLTNIKNALPVVAKYTILGVTDTPLGFPILATDTDKAATDLVVTLDETTLPEGATYDDMARTVSWDAPVKGSYKVKVEVDDGVGKPVKVTYLIKVVDPNPNLDKNTAPRVSKIKNVQGLVGIPLELPIFASDRDGNDLTISVDETKAPFTLGATFDAKTNTFAWEAPTLNDLGNYKVQFSVSDGTKTVKLAVTVKIVSSLLTF